MKFSVGKKIGGGFLILLILLALISIEGYVQLRNIDLDMDDVDTRAQRISLDYQIKNSFQGVALAIRGYMVYGDEKYLTQYNDLVKVTEDLIVTRINNSSAETRPDCEKMLTQVQQYDSQITQRMVPLLKEKKVQEATAIGANVASITAEINGTLDGMIKNNESKNTQLIDSTNSAVGSSRMLILVVSLISLLAGIGLAYYITRTITVPVGIMIGGVKRLAEGDFTKDISVNAKDEIGDLAQAVNLTRGSLKELVGGVVEIAQSLAAQSEELAASAEEVSATVEEVASTTNEVAAMAEKSMENANTTSAESAKVLEVAETGGKTVKQTVEKINSISESTSKVNDSVQDLGELSAKIGNITDVITGIADQTNLLALNAAIEAARAGEQGRGFAVVAEEVRKLAEESASAAKEIGQLITQIRGGVDIAIRAMEQSEAEVSEGVRLTSEAGSALDDIIKAINKSIELVDEIGQGASQTSEGTQQLSASNEQVTSTIQQVAGSTQELADYANKLQAYVEKFKI